MRICFFGDSFVHGTGDDDCAGWPGRVCAAARRRGLDLTSYNLGIRRDTSVDIAGRWEAEAALRLLPEHDGRLVFSFGVNDCVHEHGAPRVPADASLAAARAILSRAHAGRPTLLLGPPPTCDAALDGRVELLSDGLQRLCRELAVPFLALFPLLRPSGLWHREAEEGDGIHPNRGGYALIAEAVLAWQPWRDWMDRAPRLSSPAPAPPPPAAAPPASSAAR